MPQTRQSLRLALARDRRVKVKSALAIVSATLSVLRMRWLECPLISNRVVRVPARAGHGAHLNFNAIRFRMPASPLFHDPFCGWCILRPRFATAFGRSDDATGI